MTSDVLFKVLFTGGILIFSLSLLVLKMIKKRWWAVFLVFFSIVLFSTSIFTLCLSFVVKNSYIAKEAPRLYFYMEKVNEDFVFSVKGNENERLFFLSNPPVLNLWAISILDFRIVKLTGLSSRIQLITYPEEISFNIITKFSKVFPLIKWDKKKIPFVENGKRISVMFSTNGEIFLR